jgi:hypothetical protein
MGPRIKDRRDIFGILRVDAQHYSSQSRPPGFFATATIPRFLIAPAGVLSLSPPAGMADSGISNFGSNIFSIRFYHHTYAIAKSKTTGFGLYI